MKANKNEESVGGGGGFSKERGIYTLWIMEASDGKKTSDQAKNPDVSMTNFRLEVADDDGRGAMGAYVYHSVTWLAPGVKGHGMAVHWLHATQMPYDGEFDFDEQDFLEGPHKILRALLEVEPYESKKLDAEGHPYRNEKFVIREIYTDTNPEPAELPPPPRARAAKAKPAAAAAHAASDDGQEPPW